MAQVQVENDVQALNALISSFDESKISDIQRQQDRLEHHLIALKGRMYVK